MRRTHASEGSETGRKPLGALTMRAERNLLASNPGHRRVVRCKRPCNADTGCRHPPLLQSTVRNCSLIGRSPAQCRPQATNSAQKQPKKDRIRKNRPTLPRGTLRPLNLCDRPTNSLSRVMLPRSLPEPCKRISYIPARARISLGHRQASERSARKPTAPRLPASGGHRPAPRVEPGPRTLLQTPRNEEDRVTRPGGPQRYRPDLRPRSHPAAPNSSPPCT